MGIFRSLPKERLRIGAHFTVMEAFQTKLKAAKFTPAKLTKLITQFDEALAEEDKYLKQSTSSTYSKLLETTDDERDKAYTLVKQTITQWASTTFEPQASAAKALLTVVNLYKIDVHAQSDQETGLLTNFLTDLATTDNVAHVASLGLTSVVEKLKELNEQMKTLMASRSKERSTKASAALKNARINVNAIYDQLVRLIESFSETADDPTVYDTFISEWNAEIVRICQQIGVKTSASSTSTNGSTTSGDSSSSSGSGSSSNSGSGSSSSSGSGSSSSSGSGSSSSGDDSGLGSGDLG